MHVFVFLFFFKAQESYMIFERALLVFSDRIRMILLADFDLHRHNNVIIGILDVLLLCWLCNVLWGVEWGSGWDICELERSENF